MSKYHSINNIPAKLFFDILDSKDFKLLERSTRAEDLEQVFTAIYDDWFVKSENEKSKEYLTLRENIAFITFKIESVRQVIGFLFFNKTTKEMRTTLLEDLISIGINISLDNDFTEEVTNILQVELGCIENDLNMMKMEVETIQDSQNDSVFSFYEHLISLESAHERSLDDAMVLAKFLEYEKIAIKKAKIQQQKNAKFNNQN